MTPRLPVGLVLVLALAPARAQEPAPAPKPAPPAAETPAPRIDDEAVERARAHVAVLAKAPDDAARRELYTIGAPALGPLAAALEATEDPASWTRLAETFEGILRARLEEAESRFAQQARRADAAVPPPSRADLQPERPPPPAPGPAPPAPGPAPAPPAPTAEVAPRAGVEDAFRALEAEVAPAGYAAARELAREGATRYDFMIAARAKLLADLRERLAGEATSPDETVRARAAGRLARLGPLAAPLTATLARSDDARAREVGERARDLATARLVPLVSSELHVARTFAAESLYGMGELARPALERLAREGTPDERYRAQRLLRRIDWGISDELYRRTGHLLEGFEESPWRDRRMIAYELEKQGGSEAVPALRRILVRDPSLGVKVVAAESLARLGDPSGFAYLARIGEKPLVQSPEVAADIAMDQGIRYLTIKKYDKAIAEFNRVLEVQPENEIALYNLACAYALRGEKETALDYLEKSVAAGFEDVDHIEKDKDLESLRAEPRYRKIVEALRARRPASPGERERTR